MLEVQGHENNYNYLVYEEKALQTVRFVVSIVHRILKCKYMCKFHCGIALNINLFIQYILY